jgi:hypothetical protein
LIIAASIGALHHASQHFAFIARCLQWTSRENRQCEDVHQTRSTRQALSLPECFSASFWPNLGLFGSAVSVTESARPARNAPRVVDLRLPFSVLAYRSDRAKSGILLDSVVCKLPLIPELASKGRLRVGGSSEQGESVPREEGSCGVARCGRIMANRRNPTLS